MSLFEHMSNFATTTVFSNSTLSANEAVDWRIDYQEVATQSSIQPTNNMIQLQPSTSTAEPNTYSAGMTDERPISLWDHWLADVGPPEQFAPGPPYDIFGIQGIDRPEIEEGDAEEAFINTAESVTSSGAGMMIGLAGGAIAEGLAQEQATADSNQDLMGQGVAGHSFASTFQARSDASHDALVGHENAAMITLGSAFGEEGIAAGVALAAANTFFNTNSQVEVPSNTGQMVTTGDQ